MHNLTHLKLNADKFSWSMLSNSWFKSVPQHLLDFRKVNRVLTNKMAFLIIKDGRSLESWVDFPKAKNLVIKPLANGDYIVEFLPDCECDCHLVYCLKPLPSLQKDN